MIRRRARERRAFDGGGESERPPSAGIHVACSVLTEFQKRAHERRNVLLQLIVSCAACDRLVRQALHARAKGSQIFGTGARMSDEQEPSSTPQAWSFLNSAKGFARPAEGGAGGDSFCCPA